MKLVEYTTKGVKIQNVDGEVVMADNVILTVPVVHLFHPKSSLRW